MAKPRGSTNNVRAGLFVLMAITLGFIIIVILGGVREKLKPRNAYIVRFSLVEGASGLDEGSLVKVAGRPVGRISKIKLRTEPTPAAPACVDCTIKVDKDVRFFGKPVAYLSLPLLGSGGEINFPGVGPTGETPLPADGSAIIAGTLAPPAFLASAGFGDEQKSQLQHILQRGDEITADVKSITGDFRDVATDVRGKWPNWSGRIDSISENVDTAAKKLPDAIEDARKAIADARQWFADNKDKLTRIVDNVEAATEDGRAALAHFNTETVGKLDAALDSGKLALDNAKSAVDRVDSFVAEQSPNLRRMLANFRLGSDQLKLTLAEVRRSPWRLLYRPDTQELEFELLYDAARSYAEAVSDLRGASDALNAAATRAGPGPAGASSADLEILAAHLRDSMTAYGAAEQTFLRLLAEPNSKPAPASDASPK